MNTFSKLLEFGAVTCACDEKIGLFFGKLELIGETTDKIIEVGRCQTGDDAMRKLFELVQVRRCADREKLRTDLKKAKGVKADKAVILQITSKLKLFEKRYNYLLDS